MGILAIESGIVAKVKTLLGNHVREVDSLPGPWDEDTLKRVLRALPGVYVLFAGGQPRTPGERVLLTRWFVYFVTAHVSGEAVRRRGDALQIGAYELMERTVPHLHDYTVANEGTLALVGIENLFGGALDKQGATIYAAQFQIPMALDADLDEAVLDPFETFDAQYDIPPHDAAAEHRKWLDGTETDTAPDARDTVELEQPPVTP